ncbi:hypothetical protein [Streptomyces sp. NPDC046909]|uniref:hypothetical protein n=1 Tax=Streptomyces sp. NPDC046909 TaxID=3155617 RepID=UPI0033C61C7C
MSASAVEGGGGAGVAALSAEGLEAVALEEGKVVAGGTVTAQVSDRDFPNLGTVSAKKKPVCTALAAVQAGSVLGEPASVVRRMWLGPQETSEADLGADPSDEELANAALDSTTSFVSLASYEQRAAKAVMADIGRAVEECASGFVYTAAGEDPVETVKVRKAAAPTGLRGADEVVAATLTVEVGGAKGPVEVVVVRHGGTIGYFPATSLASQATGDAFTLPAALVQAQLTRLTKTG